MSDRTAVPERAIQRARTVHRRGPSGRLVVGEYVGQLAAEAAQAVRRAGLRPGLDRSFGCEPELTGLVVAQEPVAGEELARNGMVTLYVGAPGNMPLDDRTGTSEALDEAPSPATVAPVQAEAAWAESVSARPRARRRRKPRLAGHAGPVLDVAPAPVPPGRRQDEDGEAPLTPVAQFDPAPMRGAPGEPCPPDHGGIEEGALGEPGEDELWREELIVHADDVFAGRAGGPFAWRRVYPRKRTAGVLGGGGSVRARLAEHPWLVKIAGVALLAWATVGVATTLDGHHARTPIASVITAVNHPTYRHTVGVRDRMPAPRPKPVRPVPRTRRIHAPTRYGAPPHRSPAPAPVRTPAAPPEHAVVPSEHRSAPSPLASVPAASALPREPAPAPPASASAQTPSPPTEQTGGGQFSP